MKFLVAFALAVACVHADVSHLVNSEGSASVVKYETDVQPDSFNYVYETSNGIQARANGIIKNANSETPTQEVTGEYSYPGPDGVIYTVKYVANENGFQPEGNHLPVAPAIPEAILRSLEYNSAHPQQESRFAAPVPVAPRAPVAPVFSPVYNKPSVPFRRF